MTAISVQVHFQIEIDFLVENSFRPTFTYRDESVHQSTSKIDVSSNRKSRKWSASELARRVLWELAQPVFRLSLRQFWSFRTVLLRLFGARIGQHVHIFPTVRITVPWNLTIGDNSAIGDCAILYALGPITIGERATISQYAHLCAGSHDFRRNTMDLIKPPIEIGNDAWICTDAFVGPNVRIGSRVVVGARAVVTKDIMDDTIVAGNPAKPIGTREIFSTYNSCSE